MFYLIKAFEIENKQLIYVFLPSYLNCNEHISACFMNIGRQHWIFLTCESVKTGKLSALSKKLSKPQNPRQFHLLVTRKKKQIIKLKRKIIIL